MTVAVVKLAVIAFKVAPVAEAKSRRPETDRDVPVAPVNPRLVTVPKVANKLVEVVLVPVALVHVRFVASKELKDSGFTTDRLVKVADVPTRVFTERLVMVELVEMRLVMVPVVAEKVLREVIPVAARLVVVTLVDVTSPNVPFQRFVPDPKEKARSVVGTRLELTVPETMRVEVTVAFEALKPPKRESVAVANDPLAVTEARVSDSEVRKPLHPTPFERQMPVPLIVAVVKFARSAKR